MKPHSLNLLLPCLTGILSLATAHAADIVWGTPTTVAADTDVSLTGNFDRAYHFGVTTPTTVNGVVFTGVNSNTVAGRLTLTAATNDVMSNTSSYLGNALPYSGLTVPYQDLLKSGRYVASATTDKTRIVTLLGLTPGLIYDVQFWVNDSRAGGASLFTTLTSGPNTVNLDYNNTGALGGVGEYVIGRFTADATSQTFTVFSPGGTQLNALQLRTVSTPATVTWTGAVDGDWDTVKPNWFSDVATTFADYNQVVFDESTPGTTTVNLTADRSTSGIVMNNPTKDYTFTGTGGLGGSGGLAKSGSGSLIIGNTGTNNFSGTVAVTGGKIQLLGSANRLSPNSSLTLADAADVGLEMNNLDQALAGLTGGGASGGNVVMGSGNLSFGGAGAYDGVISGTGSVTKTGTGAVTLSGVNLYTGGTTITGSLTITNPSGSGLGSGLVQVNAASTLSIGNNGTTGSIAEGTVTNNGTLRFSRSDTVTFHNPIQGTGGITQDSATGLLIFAEAKNYSGTTTLTNGGLRITHAGALGASTGTGAGTTIGGNATARLELSGGLTVAEPFSIPCKSGSFVEKPASILNLDGDNTLTGAVSLNSGGTFWTFQSDAGKLTFTGTMVNTATTNTRSIRLRGPALGEIQSNIGNSTGDTSLTGLIKEDAGIWTLTGTSTFTGPTVISGGLLLVHGSNALSPVTLEAGGTLGGTGSVGAITAAGKIAPGSNIPGSTIGTFAAAAATVNGVLELDLNGETVDKLAVTGNLDLGATSLIRITGTPLFSSYTLATAAAITGTPVLETPILGYELVVVGNALQLNSTSVGSYSSWVTANELTGNDALSDADPDHDGLKNALEFVLGSNPKNGDNTGLQPQLAANGGSVTFTFKRSVTSALQPVILVVQVSPDLATWNPADEIPIGSTSGTGPNGVTYTVTADGDFDTIVVTIPKDIATKFARLKATM